MAEGQSCDSVFPDGAQNSDVGGSIFMNFQSRIVNSPDNILETQNLSDFSGGNSCNTGNCSASGTLVPPVTFSGFLSGQPSATLGAFSAGILAPGNYENLTTGSTSDLILQPGTYTFNGNVSIGFFGYVYLQSPGTVRIYIRGSAFFNTLVEINNIGSDRQFIVYNEGGIQQQSSTISNMLAYSKGDIFVGSSASVNGALTSEGQISIGSNTTVTYNSATVSQADFNGLCTAGSSATLLYEWLFDEGTGQTANDTAGSIDLGLGSNTAAVDSNDPEWVCGYSGTALEFEGSNTEYATSLSAISPPADGSVSFWFRTAGVPSGTTRPFSHSDGWEARYDATGRIIFDINITGGNDTFRSNTVFNNMAKWYHVAAVYSATNDTYSVYVDGVLDKSGALGLSQQSASVLNVARRTWGSPSQPFSGALDEFRIYDGELTAAEVLALSNQAQATCNLNALDNFLVDTNGSNGSVCTAQRITITARDATNATLNGYTGTIQLTTSTGNGDWSLSATASDAFGTLVPGAVNSGSAQYTFDAGGADNGQITLLLSNQQAEALTVTVEDMPTMGTSTSLTFAENAFVIVENDTLDEHLIAGRRHQFSVSVIKRDITTGACGVADAYAATSIKAHIDRSVSDPNGASPVLNNAALSDTVSLPNAAPSADNINISFVSGLASFSLDTSDVGQYTIEFLDDSQTFSSANILGSSNTLTVSPFGFALGVASNPGATNATGPAFIAAGDNFGVTVTARAWAAADDSNDDGIPDTFVDADSTNNVLTGSVLASFGQESVAETVSLNAVSILPLGGPGLSSSAASGDGRVVDSFSAGVGVASDVYYADVGIIAVTAGLTDGTYLGEPSLSFTNASNNVGRFIPSYFSVVSASIDEACSVLVPYSYMGEPFRVVSTIRAFNSRNAVTTRYEGSFAKLNTGAGTFSVRGKDAVVPTALSSRITTTLTSGSWALGEGTFEADSVVNRSASVDGPYAQVDLGLRVSDTDGVGFQVTDYDLDSDNDATNDAVGFGQTDVRFGRLRLESRFGPETAPLSVPFTTEYWSGLAWVINADDSCTRIALDKISYPDGTIDLAANRSVSVGSGSTTGTYATIDGSDIRFVAGDAGHRFSAPGTGNTGQFFVDVDVSDVAWLQFDWASNGAFNETSLPSAEYNFGSYRAHDRIIFWQEIFSPQ